MASQTQGIQQLLAAEKRAAEKVAEARKSKLHFSACPVSWSLQVQSCTRFLEFFFFNFHSLQFVQENKDALNKQKRRLKMKLKSIARNVIANSKNSKIR